MDKRRFINPESRVGGGGGVSGWKILRGNIGEGDILAKTTQGFLLKADQGDKMPEVGNNKCDPELKAIRYRGWDNLSKPTQKDFLLKLETHAVQG